MPNLPSNDEITRFVTVATKITGTVQYEDAKPHWPFVVWSRRKRLIDDNMIQNSSRAQGSQVLSASLQIVKSHFDNSLIINVSDHLHFFAISR
jgi:hypothetical protein